MKIMARKRNEIMDLLVVLPWWVSMIFSGLLYITLAHIAPALPVENVFLQPMLKALPHLAPFALVFLIAAPISAFNQRRKKQLLDKQKGIDSIRDLSWKAFEELVGEAFRRRGYAVVENSAVGADGGVDLRLAKDGQTHLVQCKQWRSQKVGVSVVREMFGLMTAEQADSVIIISSGVFTQEAQAFALDKPIDLVNGAQLALLVGQVQQPKPVAPVSLGRAPSCLKCGGELVLRTANKGSNAGK